MMDTRISIIICSKNRRVELERAVASIRNSGPLGREAELVIVEEAARCEPMEGVRYVHISESGRGFGYVRNRGLAVATGQIVVFMDDDCEAEQGWLEALVHPLWSNPEVVGVAGAVSVRNCGLIGLAENILGFPGGGLRYRHQAGGKMVPTQFLSTCNCAYRSHVLQQVGGFNEEAYAGGEDFLLAERVRALGACLYVPQAVVFHRTRDRIHKVFFWFIRRGRSESRLLTLTNNPVEYAAFFVRSSWTLRGLLILFCAFLWPGKMLIGLPLAGVGYGVCILWRFRFALKYRRFRKAWLLVPMVKMTMDLGAEVGRWKGLLSHGRA